MPAKGYRKKEGKRCEIKLRLSTKEMNRARTLAKLYADGNLSRWARHAILNADRRFLKKTKTR